MAAKEEPKFQLISKNNLSGAFVIHCDRPYSHGPYTRYPISAGLNVIPIIRLDGLKMPFPPSQSKDQKKNPKGNFRSTFESKPQDPAFQVMKMIDAEIINTASIQLGIPVSKMDALFSASFKNHLPNEEQKKKGYGESWLLNTEMKTDPYTSVTTVYLYDSETHNQMATTQLFQVPNWYDVFISPVALRRSNSDPNGFKVIWQVHTMHKVKEPPRVSDLKESINFGF